MKAKQIITGVIAWTIIVTALHLSLNVDWSAFFKPPPLAPPGTLTRSQPGIARSIRFLSQSHGLMMEAFAR